MGHGVATIIFRKRNGKNEFLLFSPKKLDKGYEGFYRPIGGWIKDGEDEKNTVIREVKEELGVVAVPMVKIDETPGDIPELTLHWWLGRLANDNAEMVLESSAIDHVRWFKLDEIVKLEKLYPATRKIFEKHLDSLQKI